MQWMKRRLGLGAAALLAATALLFAPSAFALEINPTTVYLLPSSDTPTFNVDQSWTRLHPFETGDPVTPYDYSDGLGMEYVEGSGTMTDAWVWNLTFEVAWNGTVNGLPLGGVPTSTYSAYGEGPEQQYASQLLFLIVDYRFEHYDPPRETYYDTFKLEDSGFVRAGGFAVDGSPVTPLIVSDDWGLTGIPDYDYPENWIGFLIDIDPENPTATHLITLQYALGENPLPQTLGDGENLWFPNAVFLQTVPEPGTATLMGVALLILGAARARHRAA